MNDTPDVDLEHVTTVTLPDRLPYRLLTGGDDRAFCEKVSTALLNGYVLHGGPTIAWDGERMIAAQAVVLPS